MQIVFFIFLFELFIYFLSKKCSSVLSKKDLFPKISLELSQKYKSFDSELGWLNQKNSIKKKIENNNPITYTYNDIGSRSLRIIDNKLHKISTYGDSFCHCNEVSDDETWQYFLSNELNCDISNFGVGNYGFDQALLRLKKNYKDYPTKNVIMTFNSENILRNLSCWKHFNEFHNILAFKPRYIVKNESLELIPNIIKNKEQLINYEDSKEFILTYDEHYSYLNNHIYKFPYIFSFLKYPSALLRCIYLRISHLLMKINFKSLSDFFLYHYFLPRILYKKKIAAKSIKLGNLLIDEFISFSKLHNFNPILVIIPFREDINYYNKTKDDYIKKYIDNEKEIKIIDFTKIFLNDDTNISKLYGNSFTGGHLNKQGNHRIALQLKSYFNEKN